MHHGLKFFLVLLASAGLSSCGNPPRKNSPEAPRVPVQTVGVTRLSTAPSSWAPGILAARESAAIAARASALVGEVSVREGERVEAGRLLLRLDEREVRARMAAAEANDAAARAERDRIDTLVEKRAATEREQEQAAAAAEVARAGVAEAKAALSYRRVAAPYAGRVASVLVHRGDLVVPGQRLIVVETGGPLELQATVESSTAALLSEGQSISVKVDGRSGPISARVRSISPSGDPETHRFLLRADLSPDPELKPGLFAATEIPGGVAVAIVAIPPEAIFERGGLTGVFVVDGGRALLRWIETGERLGRLLEVRSGLKVGERVVLAPSGLADGALVEEAP